MRISNDIYVDGRLVNGFDYDNQAWVVDGKYVRCGHPPNMNCGCYGRTHEGMHTVQRPGVKVNIEDVLASRREEQLRHTRGIGQ